MAVAKKARESFTEVKGSSAMLEADPKVDKSRPTRDVGVSDLLKMNFLPSLSAYVKLVDHIHQVSNLDTFSSLFLEKQREMIDKMGLLHCIRQSGMSNALPIDGIYGRSLIDFFVGSLHGPLFSTCDLLIGRSDMVQKESPKFLYERIFLVEDLLLSSES